MLPDVLIDEDNLASFGPVWPVLGPSGSRSSKTNARLRMVEPGTRERDHFAACGSRRPAVAGPASIAGNIRLRARGGGRDGRGGAESVARRGARRRHLLS